MYILLLGNYFIESVLNARDSGCSLKQEHWMCSENACQIIGQYQGHIYEKTHSHGSIDFDKMRRIASYATGHGSY